MGKSCQVKRNRVNIVQFYLSQFETVLWYHNFNVEGEIVYSRHDS